MVKAVIMPKLGQSEETVKIVRWRKQLGETIAKISSISKERVDEVVSKFSHAAEAQSLIVSDTGNYIRSVLKRALGDDKASLLIDRILQGGDVSGIESLKWMDPFSVAELLRNEHPQIVAAILVHLDYEQSSAVLKLLVDRQRNEVLLRIATMEGIQPMALKDLNEVLFNVLAGGDKVRKASLGGIKATAEIVNLLGTNIEAVVLESIRAHDPDLAQKITDKMFVFDDIIKLDDKAIQLVLKEVSSEALIPALKGASPELKDKILANMSTRAADTLREDLESRGPMRLSEVEAQQKEILKTVRRLADEGQIMIGGGGEEAFV